MNSPLPRPFRARRSGVILLATLLLMALGTIIAVAFLGMMVWDRESARSSFENQKARGLAMVGLDTAVAQIRQALGPWDSPYANFATNPPAFYWSISPGIISRWSYDSTTPVNYPLFSVDPNGSTALVNLNSPRSDGTCPIAGETSATNISVYWVNVLKNPANTTAGPSNPIVGRYAYWVDDESAKININTADGTMKYQTNSLGLGSPSEVSLLALTQDSTALATNVATNIVYLARTTGFNSPQEILRAPGTTPTLYTDNAFDLTTCSSSPDLNIFGQPRMTLLPAIGDSSPFATDMIINSDTLQPLHEIYPTPSQLPNYNVQDPFSRNIYWLLYPDPATLGTPTPVPWPLAFRANDPPVVNNEYGIGAGGMNNAYVQPNCSWINGLMLANYLAGTNAAGQPRQWPVLPGSSALGFLGKYSMRQIDSIVAQIVSFGVKDISPDYFEHTASSFVQTPGNRGRRAISTPNLYFGWLSHQWVPGLGRTPKVDAMEFKFTTYGSVNSPTDLTTYQPPYAQMDIWQEWWLPAGYLGGNNILPIAVNGGSINFGVESQRGTLNTGDLTAAVYNPEATGPPSYYWPPAPIPRADNITANYWGNQLLTNNEGIDFQSNPNNYDDPDQPDAQTNHPYLLGKAGDALVAGSGFNTGGQYNLFFASPFGMTPLQDENPPQDWAPGEMRCVQGAWNDVTELDMNTNAGTPASVYTNLVVGGGIQVRTEIIGNTISDLDPVPLECIRGTAGGVIGGNSGSGQELYDNEAWASAPVGTFPGSPNGTTVRSRNVASVIPIACSVPVAAPGDDGSGPLGHAYVLVTVADPLVNKFPGDWFVTSSTLPINVPSYWDQTTPNTFASSTEYLTGFHTQLSGTIKTAAGNVQGDPDSYWLPQADCAVSYLSDIPSQTLIPRCARFPSIGYLQYVRTGVMPDDESVAYSSQHGTPFRLLSYASSTDAVDQSTTYSTSHPYPDWAMLDLLYMPSFLASYGSPYGYYDINNNWTGFGNPAVLAAYSTQGGATPGRINPNGAVIYTTNATVPQPGIARTLPLQAMFQGLSVNQTLDSSATTPNPNFIGGTPVDAAGLAQDVYNYLTLNGPFCLPGEICNVPEIAALHSPVNPTRNDLVRQVVGNLTTQSNTFSIWVAGQSIQKSKANNNPSNQGIYEAGDVIASRVRYHFVVQRYLDPGADGVYGNAANATVSATNGTYADPMNSANHPFCPQYLYRIVSTEEIY